MLENTISEARYRWAFLFKLLKLDLNWVLNIERGNLLQKTKIQYLYVIADILNMLINGHLTYL